MSIYFIANIVNKSQLHYDIVLNDYTIVLKINTQHFYNNDKYRAKVIL